MASLRMSALIAVVAIFACLGSVYASNHDYCTRCAAACGLDYFPPKPPVYRPYETSKSVYQSYDPGYDEPEKPGYEEPPEKPDYEEPPEKPGYKEPKKPEKPDYDDEEPPEKPGYKEPKKPDYDDEDPYIAPPVDRSCEKHASYCDFKFKGVKVPTFDLKGRGDNAYDPVILDKYGRIVKVLNANGRCTVFNSRLDCRENFYFKNRKVATRTFNRIPVQEFKGKCIRLEVSSAQLADNSNLNPGDSNYVYPESRRCVVFYTV